VHERELAAQAVAGLREVLLRAGADVVQLGRDAGRGRAEGVVQGDGDRERRGWFVQHGHAGGCAGPGQHIKGLEADVLQAVAAGLVGDELLGRGGVGRAGEAAAGYGQGPQVLLEAAVHHDFADDQPIECGSGGGLAAERGGQGQNGQREADEQSGHADLQRVARLQVCHPGGRIVPDGASRFTAGVDRETVFSLGSTESFRAAARTAAVFRLQRGRR